MWSKLKREWKTFAWGIASSLVTLYDAIVLSGVDIGPAIPEQYRPFVMVAIPFGFFFLRKWTEERDDNV
jgi:hypothetical protein